MHDELCKLLGNRPQSCCAVHDAFDRETGQGLQDQVQIRECDATFYVHQYKLMEGIDDPRCALLAIFDGFSSDRQVVQQIGRILRNPRPGQPPKPGYVLATQREGVSQAWNRYLKFDLACSEHGRNPFLRNLNPVEDILEVLPENDYIHGKFRTRADFSANGIVEELIIPKSAIVYEIDSLFELSAAKDAILKGLDETDRTLVKTHESEDGLCFAFLSVLLRQTPLLEKSVFSDLRLTATVLKRTDGFLFLYDNAGLWLDDGLKHAKRVGCVVMQSLFPAKEGVRVSSMTVKNGDLSPFAIRSRTMSAVSLSQSVPFMGDNTNVITRLSGRPEEGVRRYLGISRGRIRDDSAEGATLQAYSAWAERVAMELKAKNRPATLFSRFATPVGVPIDPAPLDILIDPDELDSKFRRKGKTLDIGETYCEITKRVGVDLSEKFPFEFSLEINEETATVDIGFDRKRAKYRVRSRDLSGFSAVDNPKLSLVKKLNRSQPFRIVPNTQAVLYAYRQFYSTNLQFGPNAGVTFITDILTQIPELNQIKSEKGKATGKRGTWQPNSLFSFIDRAFKDKTLSSLSRDLLVWSARIWGPRSQTSLHTIKASRELFSFTRRRILPRPV